MLTRRLPTGERLPARLHHHRGNACPPSPLFALLGKHAHSPRGKCSRMLTTPTTSVSGLLRHSRLIRANLENGVVGVVREMPPLGGYLSFPNVPESKGGVG